MLSQRINWTDQTVSFGYFANQVESGLIDLDPAHQRGVVHDIGWQSHVLHSGLYEGDIPEVYFHERERREGKVLESLDGKQRCSAVIGYLSDHYAYAGAEPEEMRGRKFSELSESLQNTLKQQCTLRMRIAKQTLTDEQIQRFFQKRQNAKTTSTGEHLNSCITSPLLKPLLELMKEEEVAAHLQTISRTNKRHNYLEMLTRIARCYSESEKIDCSQATLISWFVSDLAGADQALMLAVVRKTLAVLADSQLPSRNSKSTYLAVAAYLVQDCMEDWPNDDGEEMFMEQELAELEETIGGGKLDLMAENGEKNSTMRAFINLQQFVADFRDGSITYSDEE